MDSGNRRALSARRRRRVGAADRSDDVPRRARGAVVMELHPKAREGILHPALDLADDGARRVLVDGSVSVLLVLRSWPRPDVFPHRNLGWRQSTLRSDQVLPVHVGRIGVLLLGVLKMFFLTLDHACA